MMQSLKRFATLIVLFCVISYGTVEFLGRGSCLIDENICRYVFNGLPAICAWMLDFDGVAQYQYNGVWMVLTVPITIILWIAVGRIRVYNYPVFRMILPDGKTKPVKSDNARNSSLWATIKDLKEIAGWGPLLAVGGFLLFMFLGTLAAILTPD